MAQSQIVLTEGEALQFLAFCISSARCLMDEPCDYGPMRLLQGASNFIQLVKSQATEETQTALGSIEQAIPVAQKERIKNPQTYIQFLDRLCMAIAAELKRVDSLP